MLLTVAFWLAFTGLFAYGQGLLMPAIKRTEPGAEAKRQAFALHWVFGAVWALPILLAWHYTHRWELAAIAVLVRVAFFDVLLNKAEGSFPFAVGNTAKSDRLLRWISGKTGIPVTYLNAVLKAFSLVFLVAFIVVFR